MEILKILKERIIAGKVLRNKAFKIASDQKYYGYQTGLASMVYKFFDKNDQVVALIMRSNKIYN